MGPEIRYNIKDLPEHGVRLTGPSDPAFDRLFRQLPGKHSDQEDLRPFTILVENSAAKRVVAYSLIWEVTDTDGQTRASIHSEASTAFLMEYLGRAAPGDGMSIPPGSARPASLYPRLGEPRAEPASPGGERLSGGQPEGEREAPSAAAARLELARHMTARLKSTTAITVSLDGVFFDDGSFVGPDTSGFFHRIKAGCDARRDLYTSLLSDFGSEQAQDAALDRLRKLSDAKSAENKALEKASGKAYAMGQMMSARELVRVWERQGPDGTVNLIRSRLENPWAELRKE